MAKPAVTRVIACGATAVEVAPDNPGRTYALLVNDDPTSPVYLGLGDSSVAVGHGIRLNVAGGSFEINLTNPWTGPIYAAAAAAANLLVTEY